MSGPSALVLRGKKLYVTIGSGDAMLNVGPGWKPLIQIRRRRFLTRCWS